MVKEFSLSGELAKDCQSITFTFGSSLSRLLTHLVGKELLVNIKPMEYKRSLAQNRWYWGVAVPTIRAWHKETQGEEPGKDAIHAYNLTKVCDTKPKFKEVMGQEVMYFETKTTSQMNTKEFMAFKDRLQMFWGELGCEIRDPKGNNLTEDHLQWRN